MRPGFGRRRSDDPLKAVRDQLHLTRERTNFRFVNLLNGADAAGCVSTYAQQMSELMEQFGCAIHDQTPGMTHENSEAVSRVSLSVFRLSTQARINSQMALVAKLTPSTESHRLATSVLLLLQDSLFVLSQTEMMLGAAREQTEAAKRDGLA